MADGLEQELIPDEASETVSARELLVLRQSMRVLIQRNQELEAKLLSDNAGTEERAERRTSMSSTRIGGEGSRGGRSLDRTTAEGAPLRKRYLEQSTLGKTDLEAIDSHFGTAGKPGVSYQCEVRSRTAMVHVEPACEDTGGVSSTSHDLLELGEQHMAEGVNMGTPIHVAGVGWVVPLGEGSGITSPAPTTNKGQGKGDTASPNTPWIGSPQPVSQQSVGTTNPGAGLDAEMERRARVAEQQRVEGQMLGVGSRDEGFHTARSQHVPPLDLSRLSGIGIVRTQEGETPAVPVPRTECRSGHAGSCICQSTTSRWPFCLLRVPRNGRASAIVRGQCGSEVWSVG